MNVKIEKVRAVMLDIDNTLLDFHKSAEFAMAEAFKCYGLEFLPEYVKTFHKINDGLWQEIEKGTLTREELWEVRFNKILDALGLKGDGPKIEKEFRRVLFDCAILVDGAIELLIYLSKKYKIYAATNAIYNQQINRLTKAGIIKYFDGIFVSEKIGHQKPTKAFFDYCFNQMDEINPEETVMIGDSLTADIEGGLSYGMHTIWFNKAEKSSCKVHPHFIVKTLNEIKSIL